MNTTKFKFWASRLRLALAKAIQPAGFIRSIILVTGLFFLIGLTNSHADVSKVQPAASHHNGYASSFTASLSGQPAEGNLLLLFFSAKQSAPN
ncbi:hypothetical protein MLD52_20485, partial [Puniceicoccaceae bacterium K14]|nr:hypothetical protein [Puniceicoccaceae bacterium K14]